MRYGDTAYCRNDYIRDVSAHLFFIRKTGRNHILTNGSKQCLKINFCPMCGRNLATDNEVDDGK